MTKPTEAVRATTGDASSAPMTANKGGGSPVVSGSGPGEWNNALLNDIVRVAAGKDLRGDDMRAAVPRVRAAVEVMRGIGADDVIADMVAAQLVSAHHAAMNCYQRATGGDGNDVLPLEIWREYMN